MSTRTSLIDEDSAHRVLDDTDDDIDARRRLTHVTQEDPAARTLGLTAIHDAAATFRGTGMMVHVDSKPLAVTFS